MNFIEEQKKTIIEENNTAQNDLLDFLEHLNPQVSEILLREPLSGDVDFTILKECNFTNITSIEFVKGKITQLKNIPVGITKLVCPENLLTDIQELPESLVELNLKGNGIKYLPLDDLSNLKELNISNNHFSSLETLPKSLEILKCENNYLKKLDLDGMDSLKTLHCSNNPLLVVEHFPENVVDFVMSNNPMTEIQRLSDNADEENESDAEQTNRLDFLESLNTYFELKTEYNEKVYDMKKTVFDKAKSKKSAKKLIQELKPKCINCARPVGSIFKNEGRTYIARCGDEKHPCNFHIQLYAGEYGNVSDLIANFQEYVETHKENIIKHKLDTLFNYVSEKEAVAIFKKEFDDYTESNTFLKELVNEYTHIYFNEERREKVNKKMEQIKKIQERINDMFIKYKTTENAELLKDAMSVYVQELKPEIENLRLLKYETFEVNYDKESDIYSVYQTEYRLDKLDFTFGSYPKVVKFQRK